MVLNNIIIMVGLSLEVSVLHSVTVGNLVTWLFLLGFFMLGFEDQVSLSVNMSENLFMWSLDLFSGDSSQECDNSKCNFHFLFIFIIRLYFVKINEIYFRPNNGYLN